MSGVQTGSRLDRLLALRSQIDMEIAAERRKEALSAPPPAPENLTDYEIRSRRQKASAEVTRKRLAQLGVTSREVKEWAVRAGHLAAVTRGRVALDLIDDYVHAHQRKP